MMKTRRCGADYAFDKHYSSREHQKVVEEINNEIRCHQAYNPTSQYVKKTVIRTQHSNFATKWL